MLVDILTKYDLKRKFEEWGTFSFSLEGCEALIEYFAEFSENVDCDIVALRCDFYEYTSIFEAGEEYFDLDEIKKEIKEREGEDLSESELNDLLEEELEERFQENTFCQKLSNNHFLMQRY
jgi:hypothetical protein